MAADIDRLRELVEPVVSGHGYDLEDLVVTPAGQRRQVRVLIDSDHGVDMDAVAEVSRGISEVLDGRTGQDDPLGDQAYTLEVSSPGVGRPLTLPRHFRRAAGRLITLRTTDGQARQVRILSADDQAVTVLQGPASTTVEVVPLDTVTRAGVEVEFSPPPPAVRDLLAAAGADHADTAELEEER